MVDKYLDYQTRIYQINPNLARAPQGQPTKKQRQKQKEKQQNAAATDSIAFQSNRTAQRLNSRIQKLQSDMLFDQQVADERWSALRMQYEIDACAQKRFEIEDSEPGSGSVDIGVDRLFVEDPDEKEIAPESTSISMREFDPWTGTGPRRILEDTCKAR